MYSISFSSTRDLSDFLSVNDVEYVDVFCAESKVRFISSTNEVFACLDVKADCSRDSKDFSCRIHSKILKSISEDSVLRLDCNGDEIVLYFLHSSGQLYYSCRFGKQVVYDTLYSDRISIIEECDSEVFIDSDQFLDVSKVAKMFNSYVAVDSGVAGVVLRSGPRMYKKVSTKRSFSMTGDTISALRKCNKEFVSIKNFLFAKRNEFSVLARKVNELGNQEYTLLHDKKFGAKCIVRVNFRFLLNFFAKTHIKIDSVYVNAKDKCVEIEGFNSTFKIPIDLDVVEIAEGVEVDDFRVPAAVIFGMLNQLKGTEYFLRQKKSFIQFDQDEYTIVW
jgi:hypothetical protein